MSADRARLPLYDETAPITCTIGADEVPERVEVFERMRANLTAVERTEHGLLLRFPPRPDIRADLERFTVEEKRCCQFWGFAVQSRPGGELALVWDGPPTAGELVDRLHRWFEGDEPMTIIAGLL